MTTQIKIRITDKAGNRVAGARVAIFDGDTEIRSFISADGESSFEPSQQYSGHLLRVRVSKGDSTQEKTCALEGDVIPLAFELEEKRIPVPPVGPIRRLAIMIIATILIIAAVMAMVRMCGSGDKRYVFTSVRRVLSGDETNVYTMHYVVNRKNGNNPLGEFQLREIQVEGPARQHAATRLVIGHLEGTAGEVAKDASNIVQISEWPAFRAYTNQLGGLAEEIADDSSLDLLGESILASLAYMEMNFDLAAIFSTAPLDSDAPAPDWDLQAATEHVSSIRVQGSRAASREGDTHTYRVVRKAANEERFTSIGRAMYRASDGMLQKLDVSVDSNSISLRIQIERRGNSD